MRGGVGQSGAPSAKTIVPPSAPTPTTVHGPMIQPMSVAKRRTSPSGTSAWHATSHTARPRAHDPAHVGGKVQDVALVHVGLLRDLACDRDEEAALHVHDA